MKNQRYMIKDDQDRVLSVFRTNAVPPESAIPIDDEVEIPGDLYAGDEPRIRHRDKVEELYPSAPGEDYDWDSSNKVWKKRPEPVDRIAELEARVNQLEEAASGIRGRIA